MNLKKSKNSSPRIKVIQKLYNSLMNPGIEIEFPKNQYKKFIKDVVNGTLERSDLIEEAINTHLADDIKLCKTDKLLKIILFAGVFEPGISFCRKVHRHTVLFSCENDFLLPNPPCSELLLLH